MSLKLVRCPTTKLDFPLGVDPIPHRQDRLLPVRVHQPRNLSISHGLNYSEFPNSCVGREFLVVIKRYKIIAYDFENLGTVPKFCHLQAATPCEPHERKPRAIAITPHRMDGATPPGSVTCLSPDAVSQGG